MKSYFCVAPTVLATCLAFFSESRAQQSSPAPDDAARWEAVLESDAAVYDKAMACRALSLKGDDRAVSALAALLIDGRLSTYARSALEAIPGEGASRALRDSIDHLQADALVGVLGSIGKRRDARALQKLSQLLSAGEGRVASAAARALGRIGTVEAADVLRNAVTNVSPAPRPAVAWAELECAAELERSNETEVARDLYESVRQSDLPRSLVVAATKRIIALGGQQGHALLSEALSSDHEQAFRMGLQAARELGPSSTPILLRYLETAPPTRQVLLLVALRDGRDREALPAILQAASSTAAIVRQQAMESLSGFQSSAVVETLFRGIGDPDAAVAEAATDSLAALRSGNVDGRIVGILQGPKSRVTSRALDVARLRQIGAASEALFKMADNNSHLAATRALGSTIDLASMPRLVRLAMRSVGEQRAAAEQALSTASARLPREASAEILAGAVCDAELNNQVMLLEVLGELGGKTALRTMSAMARADEDGLQDVATRLLGAWPTSDVSEVLRELAMTLKNPKYRIRALRGYIRAARQLEMETSERIAVCRDTLELAERVDEKKLVLDVLRRYPTTDGLALAASLLDQSEIRGAAFAAVLNISPRLVQQQPSTTEAVLERAGGLTTEQRSELAEALSRARQFAAQEEQREGFVSLFDGQTLAGWHGNLEIFRVEEGQIVGGSLQKPIERNEFLRTDRTYGDFELRLQFKLVGEKPNAGVQIRTQEIPGHHEVSGYQADLGPGYWGCLYDESRRRRILAGPRDHERDAPVRVNDWNDYRILCEGNRIRLWINGVPTVDYTESDPEIPLSGIIAVQVHSGDPMEARYRNLRIKQLRARQQRE